MHSSDFTLIFSPGSWNRPRGNLFGLDLESSVVGRVTFITVSEVVIEANPYSGDSINAIEPLVGELGSFASFTGERLILEVKKLLFMLWELEMLLSMLPS